jgi:transcriptional regulator with XRE-family HTH domain
MFGEFFKKARKKKGITQQKMANLIGCNKSYICALEKGVFKQPSYQRIMKICEILELDPTSDDVRGAMG